jgi:hypothetical protein
VVQGKASYHPVNAALLSLQDSSGYQVLPERRTSSQASSSPVSTRSSKSAKEAWRMGCLRKSDTESLNPFVYAFWNRSACAHRAFGS